MDESKMITMDLKCHLYHQHKKDKWKFQSSSPPKKFVVHHML